MIRNHLNHHHHNLFGHRNRHRFIIKRRTLLFLFVLFSSCLVGIYYFLNMSYQLLSTSDYDNHHQQQHHQKSEGKNQNVEREDDDAVDEIQSSRNLANTTPSLYTYGVCVMTRVHNCAYMISEWIEYHRAAGVHHFYIADDCSTDDGRTHYILNKYQTTGLVTFNASQPFNNCSNHQPDEDNLFRMLFQIARYQCDWLGIWDVDEYITTTSNHHWDKHSLYSFLENNSYHGFYRLPWWIMSSGMLEERPQGLIIENYHHGKLAMDHIKTLSKTSLISNWGFSLYPFAYEPNVSEDVVNYLTTPHLHEEEFIKNESCTYPTSSLYLRHYMGLSFEEYMYGRGSYKITSNGWVNPWAINPRSSWLTSFNFTSNCTMEGELFKRKMIQRVRVALKKMWGSEVGPQLKEKGPW